MRGACMECRSWEEEMFWTHFQTIHFSQFLRANFDQKLAIPEKFARNFRKKLPETVTLKGPGGITWDVKLSAKDDNLYFADGWQEFVSENSLEENDFLIFTYNGMSHFDVLMFDGGSLCEKASSYFIRRCGHTQHDSGCQTTERSQGTPIEVGHISSQCGNGENPLEKSMTGTVKISGKGGHSTKAHRSRGSKRHKALSAGALRVKKEPDADDAYVNECVESERTSLKGNPLSYTQYRSRRRPVSEDEKNNALHLAVGAASDKGFTVIMRTTMVYKRFYMAVPTSWSSRYFPHTENRDVILRVNEKTWKVGYYYQQSRCSGGLSSRWKHFALDNNLEEHDVCVFEPANLASDPVTLDVNIFRVVNEVVPLSISQMKSPKHEDCNSSSFTLVGGRNVCS